MRKTVSQEVVAGDGSDAVELIREAERLRWNVGSTFRDRLVESLYDEAAWLTARAVRSADDAPRRDVEGTVDRIVTSRVWGFPIMFLLFALVFWITISGANVPSAALASVLLDRGHPALRGLFELMGAPWWITGLVVDGMYLATAWVVSVMLPPMAIFFPLFTLLEDLGYLPRVAFNMDSLFRRSGAHGKQSLTMMMGFGCNAAGVVAARVIDSPRERLIAILTNNFALCNGRWPTQILIASIFLAGAVPAAFAGLVSAGAVIVVALLGVFLSIAVSWVLSRSLLKGEVSAFSLELPPYRPPQVLQTLYTSLIDRTLFVLWRAVVFALPAGAVIWIISNVGVGGESVAAWLIDGLNPFAVLLGMNGIILLAYVVAIPANEIVIPTVLMLTSLVTNVANPSGAPGVMFELEGLGDTYEVLTAGGWTVLTGINVMLFSLLHNPCSTTMYTIYKETGSWKWTALSAVIPLAMGFALTFLTTQVWRLVVGG